MNQSIAPLILPAIRIRQGNDTLYSTAIDASIIVSHTSTDEYILDEDTDTPDGYNRNYTFRKELVELIAEQTAPIPTNLVLAVRDNVQFVPSTLNADIGTIVIKSKMWFVDGVHRSGSLVEAIKLNPQLAKYQFPVVILPNTNINVEKSQFLRINQTQRKIKSTHVIAVACTLPINPDNPQEYSFIKDLDMAKRYTRIVHSLNKTPNSPWYGQINIAGVKTNSGIITDTSLGKSLVPLIRLMEYKTDEAIITYINNFWNACLDLVPVARLNPKKFWLQKQGGTTILNYVAMKMHMLCIDDNSTNHIKSLLNNLPDFTEGFWRTGSYGKIYSHGSGSQLKADEWSRLINSTCNLTSEVNT